MARPRSEDKRNAILAAANAVFAELGTGAPTARIAKQAGVAEGTLFTYFATKDELLNQLYLTLKAELQEVMMSSYPKSKSVKSRLRHVWQTYLDWGVAQPQKRKVMAQLGLSERVSAHSKAAGARAFAEVDATLNESIASGLLRDHPSGFVAAIMGALADTTMDFMVREPAQAERYSSAGFEAFWNAIARK